MTERKQEGGLGKGMKGRMGADLGLEERHHIQRFLHRFLGGASVDGTDMLLHKRCFGHGILLLLRVVPTPVLVTYCHQFCAVWYLIFYRGMYPATETTSSKKTREETR